MLHRHHFVDTKQWLDMNLRYHLKKTLSLTHVRYVRSMNRNSSLLFLAIQTEIHFPNWDGFGFSYPNLFYSWQGRKRFTPLECCIVNAFTIRLSPLDLIKMSIREPIFSLPIQQTDKAQRPVAIYPFLFIFKNPSGFPSSVKCMLSSGMNQCLVIEIH